MSSQPVAELGIGLVETSSYLERAHAGSVAVVALAG
jgi:hypothetical protein